MSNIARYIDHTILKPTTTRIEINRICKESVEYGFAAACVPPTWVKAAGDALAAAAGMPGRGAIKVATVIGFPFGYSVVAAKLAEAEQALADGADELDVVINLVALKDGNWKALEEEMRSLTERVHAEGRIIKVIVESGILSDAEIIRCCEIYGPLGIDFMKTSTGYAERGATVEAVELMRRHLPAGVRIKASGGIRQTDFARQLIAAGADRLGCSASVEIVKGEVAGGGGY